MWVLKNGNKNGRKKKENHSFKIVFVLLDDATAMRRDNENDEILCFKIDFFFLFGKVDLLINY